MQAITQTWMNLRRRTFEEAPEIRRRVLAVRRDMGRRLRVLTDGIERLCVSLRRRISREAPELWGRTRALLRATGRRLRVPAAWAGWYGRLVAWWQGTGPTRTAFQEAAPTAPAAVSASAASPPPPVRCPATGEVSCSITRDIENSIICIKMQLLKDVPGEPTQRRTAPLSNPAMVVEAVAQDAAARAGRTADLQLEIENTGPVLMPESNFVKVLAEVLDNAFRFSMPGDTVRVKARKTSVGFVVEVRDHGPGMRRNQIRRVFNSARFQLDGCARPPEHLGLYLARKITQLNDGEFVIGSAPGRGTRVTLSVPLAESPFADRRLATMKTTTLPRSASPGTKAA